jgi:hypothetical protein
MSYLPPYTTPLNNAVTAFLQGTSANPPAPGTNLPAPGPLGRYGKTSFSNSGAGAKVQGKQVMVMIGPRCFIAPILLLLTPAQGAANGNLGPQLPPYGN